MSTNMAEMAEKLTTPEASEITIRQVGRNTEIHLVGRITGSRAPEDRERILDALRPRGQIILDFSKVEELSGFALRNLLQLTRYVRSLGGAVAARGASEPLRAIAEASGFRDIFLRAEPVIIPEPRRATRIRTDIYPTHSCKGFDLRPGSPWPLGATELAHGINFAVYSRHATHCWLVLFERGAKEPFVEIPIPPEFRIGDVHAMTVFHLDPEEFEYGYRMDGPYDPAAGQRFDKSKILLDPMARAIAWRPHWDNQRSYRPEPRGRVIAEDFDWETDRPLGLPFESLVIYEMHVRGFTRHPSSGVRFPGTYAGLREKIPYLQELGVNCVELLPIFEFDESEVDRIDPKTGEELVNYWGYSTLAFHAPKAGYAATGGSELQADEFKTLIKDLHAAGIEVILDVVFNHTSEGNENGPTLSFRGLDNATYYMLTPEGYYYNFSGCGNTLNCNHPVVRDFVIGCLRYWVAEYHIDGFRFDLASILGRAPDGTPLANPPLLEALALDPVLGRTKLIAEAWDAGGLYQVGFFPAYGRWAEWNGKYRDCLRKFLKGDMGLAREVAQRLAGSPDLYHARGPSASINFITCHDGFTLADLVSYNDKHNEANGEENRDGANDNHSWNCGAEGPTEDPAILELRQRQMKNALALLFLSQGVPMLLMGDEVAKTQQGNNNTYCQDNALNWLDWSLKDRQAGLYRFCRLMIAFRKAHPALRHPHFPGTHPGEDQSFHLSWHGTQAWNADWQGTSRVLAFMARLHGPESHDCVYAAFNMFWEPLTFELPGLEQGWHWHRFADTGRPAPDEICELDQEVRLDNQQCVCVAGRSIVVLVGRVEPT